MGKQNNVSEQKLCNYFDCYGFKLWAVFKNTFVFIKKSFWLKINTSGIINSKATPVIINDNVKNVLFYLSDN